MKRFRFSLDRVLKLREFYERESEIELGKAVAECDRISAKLAALAEEYRRGMQNKSEARRADEMIAADKYMTRIELERRSLEEELASAELEAERKRAEYIGATRDRRVLTQLKEKRFNEYKKSALAEETRALDDIRTEDYF